MSTDLIRAPSSAVGRTGRKRTALMREAQLPAQVAAAKIEAASLAAHVALQHAAMLSAAEARLILQAPLGEARYKAIADAFAGYACHELSMLVHR